MPQIDLQNIFDQIHKEDTDRRVIIVPFSRGGTERCKCGHFKRYHIMNEFSGVLRCKYDQCKKRCKGFELSSKEKGESNG